MLLSHKAFTVRKMVDPEAFLPASVPMLSRAHVAALATGDGWIDHGGTILLFDPSGSGKSHLSAAFGHALIENGYRVLFTRTTDLVQRLQQARQALSLESAIEKLDKYHVLILVTRGKRLVVLVGHPLCHVWTAPRMQEEI
jgi:DNA replication protein DnaC